MKLTTPSVLFSPSYRSASPPGRHTSKAGSAGATSRLAQSLGAVSHATPYSLPGSCSAIMLQNSASAPQSPQCAQP